MLQLLINQIMAINQPCSLVCLSPAAAASPVAFCPLLSTSHVYSNLQIERPRLLYFLVNIFLEDGRTAELGAVNFRYHSLRQWPRL